MHAVLVHTSHVSAQRLHPFEGFTTAVADEAFPLCVDGLVSVQSARSDECLLARIAHVRPLSCVGSDVSCQVGAVTEALLADGADVGFVFALLAAAAVVVEEMREM